MLPDEMYFEEVTTSEISTTPLIVYQVKSMMLDSTSEPVQWSEQLNNKSSSEYLSLSSGYCSLLLRILQLIESAIFKQASCASVGFDQVVISAKGEIDMNYTTISDSGYEAVQAIAQIKLLPKTENNATELYLNNNTLSVDNLPNATEFLNLLTAKAKQLNDTRAFNVTVKLINDISTDKTETNTTQNLTTTKDLIPSTEILHTPSLLTFSYTTSDSTDTYPETESNLSIISTELLKTDRKTTTSSLISTTSTTNCPEKVTYRFTCEILDENGKAIQWSENLNNVNSSEYMSLAARYCSKLLLVLQSLESDIFKDSRCQSVLFVRVNVREQDNQTVKATTPTPIDRIQETVEGTAEIEVRNNGTGLYDINGTYSNGSLPNGTELSNLIDEASKRLNNTITVRLQVETTVVDVDDNMTEMSDKPVTSPIYPRSPPTQSTKSTMSTTEWSTIASKYSIPVDKHTDSMTHVSTRPMSTLSTTKSLSTTDVTPQRVIYRVKSVMQDANRKPIRWSDKLYILTSTEYLYFTNTYCSLLIQILQLFPAVRFHRVTCVSVIFIRTRIVLKHPTNNEVYDAVQAIASLEVPSRNEDNETDNFNNATAFTNMLDGAAKQINDTRYGVLGAVETTVVDVDDNMTEMSDKPVTSPIYPRSPPTQSTKSTMSTTEWSTIASKYSIPVDKHTDSMTHVSTRPMSTLSTTKSLSTTDVTPQRVIFHVKSLMLDADKIPVRWVNNLHIQTSTEYMSFTNTYCSLLLQIIKEFKAERFTHAACVSVKFMSLRVVVQKEFAYDAFDATQANASIEVPLQNADNTIDYLNNATLFAALLREKATKLNDTTYGVLGDVYITVEYPRIYHSTPTESTEDLLSKKSTPTLMSSITMDLVESDSQIPTRLPIQSSTYNAENSLFSEVITNTPFPIKTSIMPITSTFQSTPRKMLITDNKRTDFTTSTPTLFSTTSPQTTPTTTSTTTKITTQLLKTTTAPAKVIYKVASVMYKSNNQPDYWSDQLNNVFSAEYLSLSRRYCSLLLRIMQLFRRVRFRRAICVSVIFIRIRVVISRQLNNNGTNSTTLPGNQTRDRVQGIADLEIPAISGENTTESYSDNNTISNDILPNATEFTTMLKETSQQLNDTTVGVLKEVETTIQYVVPNVTSSTITQTGFTSTSPITSVDIYTTKSVNIASNTAEISTIHDEYDTAIYDDNNTISTDAPTNATEFTTMLKETSQHFSGTSIGVLKNVETTLQYVVPNVTSSTTTQTGFTSTSPITSVDIYTTKSVNIASNTAAQPQTTQENLIDQGEFSGERNGHTVIKSTIHTTSSSETTTGTASTTIVSIMMGSYSTESTSLTTIQSIHSTDTTVETIFKITVLINSFNGAPLVWSSYLLNTHSALYESVSTRLCATIVNSFQMVNSIIFSNTICRNVVFSINTINKRQITGNNVLANSDVVFNTLMATQLDGTTAKSLLATGLEKLNTGSTISFNTLSASRVTQVITCDKITTKCGNNGACRNVQNGVMCICNGNYKDRDPTNPGQFCTLEPAIITIIVLSVCLVLLLIVATIWYCKQSKHISQVKILANR